MEASRTGCWNRRPWGLALSLYTIKPYTHSRLSKSGLGQNDVPSDQVAGRDPQCRSRDGYCPTRAAAGVSVQNGMSNFEELWTY